MQKINIVQGARRIIGIQTYDMKNTFTFRIESEGIYSNLIQLLQAKVELNYFIISEESMQGIPIFLRSKILAFATSSDAAEQQSVTTIVL